MNKLHSGRILAAGEGRSVIVCFSVPITKYLKQGNFKKEGRLFGSQFWKLEVLEHGVSIPLVSGEGFVGLHNMVEGKKEHEGHTCFITT
jgi:hypothetical protein